MAPYDGATVIVRRFISPDELFLHPPRCNFECVACSEHVSMEPESVDPFHPPFCGRCSAIMLPDDSVYTLTDTPPAYDETLGELAYGHGPRDGIAADTVVLSSDSEVELEGVAPRQVVADARPQTARQKIAALDQFLASLGLRRKRVFGDGVCFFRAIAASSRASLQYADVFLDAMVRIVNSDLEGVLGSERSAEVKRQANSLATHRLRMQRRWDTELMDVVCSVMGDVLGGPYAVYRLWDDGTVFVDAHENDMAAVCLYEDESGNAHYDAVLPLEDDVEETSSDSEPATPPPRKRTRTSV